jgi:hypothetical protein
MKYLAILLLFAGCQLETVNIVIEDGGHQHTKNPAVVKYEGNEATAAKVFIIKIDRSPIKMGQKQEDVGSGNEAGL